MGIYAIRTTANKEKNVASKLADRVEKEGYNISSIIVSGLKSYILVEGDRAGRPKSRTRNPYRPELARRVLRPRSELTNRSERV